MEFKGQYLTYEDYKALGGTLDLSPFNLLEFESRRKIDLNTQNRLVGLDYDLIPQEVKLCMFKILDKVLKGYSEELNRGKSSETVGSYSVTYDDIDQIIKNKNVEIEDVILTDLIGIVVNGEHILYRGAK